jgi:TolB protein
MSAQYRSQAMISVFGIAAFFSALLLGCQQFVRPSPFPTPSSPTADAPAGTPAPTLSPSEARHKILLSVQEDGYAHLFLFSPDTAAFTRLTYGKWSDVTPALSPDGKRIAFASNRSGRWDLYVLDLLSGETTQLTHTKEYASSPTWSPDLAWIAYETYQNGSLDVAILSLANPDKPPILLTDDKGSAHSPAWAPNGREIAFVSDSSGSADIWVADLNKTEHRLTDVSNDPQASEDHPAWSPDGTHLAWASASQTSAYDGIYIWDADNPAKPANWIGSGDWPAWNAAGDKIVAVVNAANTELLTAYTLQGQPVLLPTALPGRVRGLAWPALEFPSPLPQSFQAAAAQTPEPLAQRAVAPSTGVPANRLYVVQLQNVDAPYSELQVQVERSFMALRNRVIADAGWDALASLENAYVPLTAALDPGLQQDWLYTGRAFALNSLMVNAGWMAVGREDVGAQTYWRIYLRTQSQDGSRGEPIESPPWDLNARYALDPKKYEAGGDYTKVPPGYWIDFTALAQAYGWQRLPALPSWRNYFSGTRFTEFVRTDGLDWYSAMLQLYPPEALLTPTAVLPPTATPSKTPVPTRTLGPSPTASSTPFPTSTWTPRPPTSTPLPTSTPPTIIPTFPSPTP